jgi:hypothetical protein
LVAQVTLDARLNKLAPSLSVRERALLVLGSLKDGTPEDPLWRSTMPSGQSREFNRYIDLMNVANRQIGHLVTFLEGETDKLTLRFVHLLTLRNWQLNLAEIDYAAAHLAREPITEVAHQKLVEKAKDEYVPLMKLAETLAGERRAWETADLESVPWSGDLVVKDEAWDGLSKRAAAELLAAEASGDLETKDKGGKTKVRRGSFDAYLQRPATVYPSWAEGWDIRPDAEAARVEGDRRTLAHLQLALEKPFREFGASGRASLDDVIDAVLTGAGGQPQDAVVRPAAL